MSKKKREYGIPKDEWTVNGIISGGDIIWDMHCHLDMVIEYEKNVAVEVEQKNAENLNNQNQKIIIPKISDLITESVNAGIRGFLQCACEIKGIHNISNVLDEIETISQNTFGAIAIHPNESILHHVAHNPDFKPSKTPDGLEAPIVSDLHKKYDIDDCICLIEQKCKNDPRIKVIGETGLDYFRTSENDSLIQKESLKKHIELAKSLDMPVQIHDRDAHEDIVKILEDKHPKKVLFHSFSGDVELAQICIKNGWFTSFSGPITFNANNALRDAFLLIYNIAPELLLIETDAPFLTPMPYRGRTNSPARISQTILYIAKFLLSISNTNFSNNDIEVNKKIRELANIYSKNVQSIFK